MLSHHIRTDPKQSSALVCVPVVTPGAELEGVVPPAGRKNNRATFGSARLALWLFRPSQTVAESWDEGDCINWANSSCLPG